MKVKQMAVRTILMAEMILFVYVYLFGKNGLQLVHVQKKQLLNLQNTITSLEKEVVQIEQEMEDWNLNDFYKEKIAREQLQMARKGDKLFYIGS